MADKAKKAGKTGKAGRIGRSNRADKPSKASIPDANDKAARIFGNEIDAKTYQKACEAKERFAKKFGADVEAPCHLRVEELPVIGARLGVRNLVAATEAFPTPLDLYEDARNACSEAQSDNDACAPAGEGAGTPVVVGNIRMGFGHYRIAMAMASAAHALGYVPYWFDLMSFSDTAASKIIAHQNDLYSMGSRLSQRVGAFDKLYWEPLNSEGFRKLSYNASDQKVAELMGAPYADLPRDVPFIGTHAWTAQAAVHAGLTHVVNAIPDNWPMALHLAEGAVHTIQTPSAYLGYKMLRGMDKDRALKPMPAGSIVDTGHYIDHELVVNIAADCARRRARLAGGEPVRYLLTVGGAGAQADLFRAIIEHLIPYIDAGQAALLINVGDHRNVWYKLVKQIPALAKANVHFNEFAETAAFADAALDGALEGIHVFCDDDIFAAVYSTNLLMRAADLLVTKPSELAYYPVPKVMIHRVGGHEAWGAIRAAELGDGTYELETPAEVGAFIDLVQAEPSIVSEMCDNIERAAAIGIYNGAYRVVELACKGI